MLVTQKDVAGLVVLYQPEDYVLDNIQLYLSEVETLYAVDNSEALLNSKVKEALIEHPRVTYICNGKNLGIASALNVGAKLALEAGYQWLLTMDQDSQVPPRMVELLLNEINSYPHPESIGIMSPVHMLQNGQVDTSLREKIKAGNGSVFEADTVMTSGNLLNLAIYAQVGPFLDKLFIDYVDLEYCLRLKKNGFKVLVAARVILEHSLGQIADRQLKIFTDRKFTLSNHNYVRRYYITRNRLFVQNLYKKDFPAFCRHDFKCQVKEIIKISLLESDRLKKIKYFLLGVYHYSLNRYGKL